MTDTGRELISRKQFLDMLGISDSNERRKRKGGHTWPPHLRIGNKVYYRRSAVEDFLQSQEEACNSECAGLKAATYRPAASPSERQPAPKDPAEVHSEDERL